MPLYPSNTRYRVDDSRTYNHLLENASKEVYSRILDLKRFTIMSSFNQKVLLSEFCKLNSELETIMRNVIEDDVNGDIER